jgi:hypothetical protein
MVQGVASGEDGAPCHPIIFYECFNRRRGMRCGIPKSHDQFSIRSSHLASVPFGEWSKYVGYVVVDVKFPSLSKGGNPEEIHNLSPLNYRSFSFRGAVP